MSDRAALLAQERDLIALAERRRTNRLADYRPYPKQEAFHALGKTMVPMASAPLPGLAAMAASRSRRHEAALPLFYQVRSTHERARACSSAKHKWIGLSRRNYDSVYLQPSHVVCVTWGRFV